MAGFSSGFDSGFGVSVGSLPRRHRLRWELFEVACWWPLQKQGVYLAPLTAPAAAAEPEPEAVVSGGGGVPMLPRLRLRPVELEAFGLLMIEGTGDLAVERSIAGAGPIVVVAYADLEADDERTAVMLLLGVPGV